MRRTFDAYARGGQRFESITALGKRAGLSSSTIDRLKKSQSDATLKTLDAISQAFGLRAWQMLVLDVDPAHPPRLYSDVLDPQDLAILEVFRLLKDPQRIGLMAQANASLRAQIDQESERDDRKSERA